jgi:FkbM family methyltransferase
MIFDSSTLARDLVREIIVEDSYKLRRLINCNIDNVVDVGANYGMFSLVSKIFWPKANVVAIEPNHTTFKGLHTNVRNLGVRCFRLGLGNGKPIKSQIVRPHYSGSNITVPAEDSDVDVVRSLNIFRMCRYLRIVTSENTILKIDTEGAEAMFLGDRRIPELFKRLGYVTVELHFRSGHWPTAPTERRWGHWINQFANLPNNTLEYSRYRYCGIFRLLNHKLLKV